MKTIVLNLVRWLSEWAWRAERQCFAGLVMLDGMRPTEGGFDIFFNTHPGMAELVAGAMANLVKDAPNFVELRISGPAMACRRIMGTIQKIDGLTPQEKLAAAERQVFEMGQRAGNALIEVDEAECKTRIAEERLAAAEERMRIAEGALSSTLETERAMNEPVEWDGWYMKSGSVGFTQTSLIRMKLSMRQMADFILLRVYWHMNGRNIDGVRREEHSDSACKANWNEVHRLMDQFVEKGGLRCVKGGVRAVAEAHPSGTIVSESKPLIAIAALLRTQDNRMTAEPMFCVQGRRRQYTMDTDHCDDVVWIDTDEHHEVDPPADGEETDTIVKLGYIDSWETLMVAFTEKGCQEYLHLNGHNYRHYKEVRIYVESFRRCPEMIAIRHWLLSLPEAAETPHSLPSQEGKNVKNPPAPFTKGDSGAADDPVADPSLVQEGIPTGKTYSFSSFQELVDVVPGSRIAECMTEIGRCIALGKMAQEVLWATMVGISEGRTLPSMSEALQIKVQERFEWVDDGKGELTARIELDMPTPSPEGKEETPPSLPSQEGKDVENPPATFTNGDSPSISNQQS